MGVLQMLNSAVIKHMPTSSTTANYYREHLFVLKLSDVVVNLFEITRPDGLLPLVKELTNELRSDQIPPSNLSRRPLELERDTMLHIGLRMPRLQGCPSDKAEILGHRDSRRIRQCALRSKSF